MSQSQSEGGYKAKIADAYAEARRRAKQAFGHGVTSLESCANEENLLLVLFLQEARDVMQAEGNENIAKAYGRGAKQVRQHSMRIYNKDRLLKVNGFGPATTNAVERHLWSDPACRPRPPDKEELDGEQCYYDAVRRQELSRKEAEKQRKADERTAKRQADQMAAMLASGQAQAPSAARRKQAAAVASSDAAGGDESGGHQPKKRQRKQAKKEYIPGVGTANYAFMIALFQAQRRGEVYLTKHDLINQAEGLHLTNKPIKGNPNVPTGPGMFVYDGWSCFNSLTNREPPLAQVYSNPKKCRLTPEGEVLARRLYKDATERQSIPPDPAILDYIRRTEPAGMAAGIGEAPAPSQPPAATTASRPPPTGRPAHSLPQQRWGQEGSGSRATAGSSQSHPVGSGAPPSRSAPAGVAEMSGMGSQTTKGASASLAPGLRGSHSAGAAMPFGGILPPQPPENIARDADVAHLVSMGFTPDQATKGLAGGQSVEEAVGVIVIDSSDDEERPEPQARPRAADAAAFATSGSQHGSSSQPAGLQKQPANPGPAPAKTAATYPARLPAECGSSQTQNGAGINPRPSSQPSLLRQAARNAVRAAGTAPAASSQEASSAAGGSAATGGSSGRLAGDTLDSLTGAGRQHHTLSRMQAAWRLKGVADRGTVKETDIRLPPLRDGECFGDRYEVALVLDHRERFGNQVRSNLESNQGSDKNAEAVRQLASLGIKVVSKSLEGGDALWVARPRGGAGGSAMYVLDTVIERKRVDDLAASIKDQRYERQKYFLARCGVRRTMYVLEGDIDLTFQGPMTKACKTALHRLEVEDGFRVLRTPDSAHTFRLYKRITDALQAKYDRLRPDSAEVAKTGRPLPTLVQLEEQLRLAKKVTLQDVWGLMLCTVPRISSETCETVLQEYPTPISLWRAYEAVMRDAMGRGQNTVAAANKLLTCLPRIGPDTSRLVFSSLFANGWQL